jgi:hypothetical protein
MLLGPTEKKPRVLLNILGHERQAATTKNDAVPNVNRDNRWSNSTSQIFDSMSFGDSHQ